MKRLAYRCLVLLTLTQACIIIDDTDENGGGAATCPAREDGACFAITAACPADAVTYSVFIHPVGAAGTLFDPDVDVFDCGAGASEVVDPGTYDIRVEAQNAEGDQLFGAEAVFEQEVADLDDVPLSFEFPEAEGFFFLAWTLEMEGGEVSCDDVGAASVEVESSLTDEGTSTTDVLPCAVGGWQTRGLDLGAYDVTIRLIGTDESVLGSTADPIAGELAVDSELVDLPPVTFDIAAAAR